MAHHGEVQHDDAMNALAVVDGRPHRIADRERSRSVGSWRSFGSAGSLLSLGSIGSVLSIGSSGSLLSIGSTGSILSIGSAGSILSIGSAGSILSIGSWCSVGAVGGAYRTLRDRASGRRRGDGATATTRPSG